MGFAKVYSAQTVLLSAHIISIEVDISRGLHAFSIVGLPDKALEESRDRVSAAVKNSGFTSPKSKNQKVVVSLAPADIKKEGPLFDLGIALAYLLAAKEIAFKSEKKLFIGELSLDGNIRPVRGVIAHVAHGKKRGFEEMYVPWENAREGALIKGVRVYGVRDLRGIIDHLNTKGEAGAKSQLAPKKVTAIVRDTPVNTIDMSDIRGQETAKRGLLIAAAGGHNIALYGPPGTGKTMLARAFSTILPPLSFENVIEVTGIHSVAGTLIRPLITNPPFRSPHHTSSYVSVVGGGTTPRPGEVTLAHRGVLFLDEFPEFDRRVIESLREPLEENAITISRAKGSARFPARFILVAALNPCPCGNFNSRKTCTCTPLALERYRKKLSGPIVDRIDMWIEVANVDYQKLGSKSGEKESEKTAKAVLVAREKQLERFNKKAGNLATNSDMRVRDIDTYIHLSDEVRDILNHAAKSLDFSPRAYHRVIKLSRTIADLAKRKEIEAEDMLEALQYRPKEHLFG